MQNKCTLDSFNRKMFLEIFCSKTLSLKLPQIGIRNYNFTDDVEITFLPMVDTFLKLPLQKVSWEMCGCSTVTFDLS